MREQITVLAGDGIGPEIMESALRVLDEVGDFEYSHGLIGGHAMEEHSGNPFPSETKELVSASQIILLGAVGGPKWDTDSHAARPENGLLELRKTVKAHANLRPIAPFSVLKNNEPFNPTSIAGTDFVIVRELLGGSYYGEKDRCGNTARDVREYSTDQVQAVGRVAFELARSRGKESKKPKVTSVDKANVLETSRLWRETIKELHEEEYADVYLENTLVDNANFQIIKSPRQFDVIVTENEFGDILSDGAAALVGSLGLIPSASLNESGGGIFEPVHGSAPDIAGQGIANPTAMILSVAMALEALERPQEAEVIRTAVNNAFATGVMTPDLCQHTGVSTQQFTEAIVRNIHNELEINTPK